MAEQTLKEKTAKGLFWGGLSSIIQQLLVAAFGIVLLRELTPGDYGMIGMLAIFTGIASTIQESGFTAALINRSTFDPRDFNAVFWFNFFVSCIFYIILFFAAPYIADFYGYPELNLISRILFISLIINSMSLSHYALLLRELMLKEKAKIDVISSIISGTTGITFALLGYGYWALVFLTLMQSVVCTTDRKSVV